MRSSVQQWELIQRDLAVAPATFEPQRFTMLKYGRPLQVNDIRWSLSPKHIRWSPSPILFLLYDVIKVGQCAKSRQHTVALTFMFHKHVQPQR